MNGSKFLQAFKFLIATKLPAESFENFEAGHRMAEKEAKDPKINFQRNFPSISEASRISETKRTMRITFGSAHTDRVAPISLPFSLHSVFHFADSYNDSRQFPRQRSRSRQQVFPRFSSLFAAAHVLALTSSERH